MKRVIIQILKFSLVGGLLYFLSQRGLMSLAETKRAMLQFHFTLPAWSCMLAAALIAIYRWHLLLKAAGIHLRWSRTVQLGCIGLFFNISLPGAVSGDVVKAIYVAREAPGKRAWALSSILYDRVAGVSALVLVSAGALLVSLFTSWGGSLLASLQLVVAAAGIGVVAFYSYLLLVKEQRDPLLKFFRVLEKKIRFAGSLTRIYEGIRNYREYRGTVCVTLLLSLVVHLLVVTACVYFSKAIGISEIPLLATFVVVPLGLFVTAIPIMPAGVGTGHAAFLALFHLLGSLRGADIFNLFLVFQIFAGLVGGLVYLQFRGDTGEKLSDMMPEKGEPQT